MRWKAIACAVSAKFKAFSFPVNKKLFHYRPIAADVMRRVHDTIRHVGVPSVFNTAKLVNVL